MQATPEKRIAKDARPCTLEHSYVTMALAYGTQNGKNVMDHRTLQSAGSSNRVQATVQ